MLSMRFAMAARAAGTRRTIRHPGTGHRSLSGWVPWRAGSRRVRRATFAHISLPGAGLRRLRVFEPGYGPGSEPPGVQQAGCGTVVVIVSADFYSAGRVDDDRFADGDGPAGGIGEDAVAEDISKAA